ncbi:MAG TPA: cation diffusion facilitator family transporter [Candidatus Gemmiger faecigallinarum]|nr:cation diffusion facilitator family transporter [Candidatus Gemmiger faecigallinarum]
MTEFLLRTFVKDAQNTADRAVRSACGNLACIVGIVCNVLLFLGKFIVGTLFGSLSITADAINNLSDASSNIVSLVGFRLGSKPADQKHPYGHARYEYLAGLAVSVMILVIGIELGKESLAKALAPTPVEFSWLSAAVLLASILVKLWLSAFNRTVGRRIHSETLLATAADSRNDVVSTAAVLVASIVAYYTGFDRLDGIMGLAVAAFILYSGVGLVRDTLDPILGAAPDPELVAQIRQKALSYPDVLGLHDLMIHDYGPGNRLVSFHLEMPAEGDVMAMHDEIDRMEKDFYTNDGLLTTIHFDPVVTGDPHVAELRTFVEETARGIDPEINIHDLRIVPGPTHTNVIFDCAAPPRYFAKGSDAGRDLLTALRDAVRQKWPDHFCVIQLEQLYADLTPET